MIIPRPLLRSPLLRSASLLCPCTIRPATVSPILSFLRTKVTINQILRGSRVPPKKKRVKKPEAPDLKQSPFKKAVVQKVFIVKPKVRPPSLPPVPQAKAAQCSFFRLARGVFCQQVYLLQMLTVETQFGAKKSRDGEIVYGPLGGGVYPRYRT